MTLFCLSHLNCAELKEQAGRVPNIPGCNSASDDGSSPFGQIQRQTHKYKYKYTDANTQMQIHRYKCSQSQYSKMQKSLFPLLDNVDEYVDFSLYNDLHKYVDLAERFRPI